MVQSLKDKFFYIFFVCVFIFYLKLKQVMKDHNQESVCTHRSVLYFSVVQIGEIRCLDLSHEKWSCGFLFSFMTRYSTGWQNVGT